MKIDLAGPRRVRPAWSTTSTTDWPGLFPILFATTGTSVGRIGILAALYPAVWGFDSSSPARYPTGSAVSNLITAGMLAQGGALPITAPSGVVVGLRMYETHFRAGPVTASDS